MLNRSIKLPLRKRNTGLGWEDGILVGRGCFVLFFALYKNCRKLSRVDF